MQKITRRASRLIDGTGASANYLQVLYTLAEHMTEHKINGVAIDKDNYINVDAQAVTEYMAENFEYVFTVYNPAGIKVGEIRKDMVYAEAEQVPSAEELQCLFPIYYDELAEFTYRYGFAIRVKTDATDGYAHCLLRNVAEVKAEENSVTAGDGESETSVMLSPHNLLTLEDSNSVQILRNYTTAGAYGKLLNYKFVGAYDMFFYLGETATDDNLIDWVRVVKETQQVGDYPHIANQYVRTFLGSSLEEKELVDVMKTGQEYIAAGVKDITATVLSDAPTRTIKSTVGW